jgi:deazaflavin-dependent oxidoreductase (nitroreductase family)
MSQNAEEFETPAREDIRDIMEGHIVEMEASNEEEVWIGSGMHHLLLTLKGRKSGAERKVALPYWNDSDGLPLIVASYSGAPQHPGWFHNLADTDANPDVIVRIRAEQFRARIGILEGDDYAENWAAMVIDRPFYQDYQDECERRIPLIRLLPLEDA